MELNKNIKVKRDEIMENELRRENMRLRKEIKDLKKNPTFNYGKAVLSMETLLDLLLGTSFGVAAILTTQYEDDYSLKDTFNEIDKQLEKMKETGKAPWENNDEDALKEE